MKIRTMTTVGCLRCGVWYDPARPHVCGVLGDDTARALEERLVVLERRVEELEAGMSQRKAAEALGIPRSTLQNDLDESRPKTGRESSIDRDERREAAIVSNEAGRGACDIDANASPEPATRPRFDRKANHRRYMRGWRARQTALRRQQQGVRP